MQDESIPYGCCQCGCGRRTTIAKKTRRQEGVTRGEPMRFLKGHAGPGRPAGRDPVPRGDRTYAVPLGNERFALIDEADVEMVRRYVWSLDSRGYTSRNRVRRDPANTPAKVRLHRALMGLVLGDGLAVDHINRDRLDNRRCNLRVVSIGENVQNQGAHSDSTSRFRGVSWNQECRCWQAHARVNGRSTYLGLFDDEKDAARAASRARKAHMPYAIEGDDAR
jgi:hypothetical protein